MITYGHEKFIEQAINGVLMQQVDFDIEFIIANDCSPDRTDAIVKKIITESPNITWIKYTNHESNLGMMPNFVWALKQAKGKYIALCEGDDYWTDPFKLQKQVDFLEKNINYSMCFHSVTIYNKISNKIYPEIVAENRNYPIDELLLTKTAHTVSFMFKNEYLTANIFLHKSLFAGDVLVALLMAEKGMVYGMQEEMAVYRIHPNGISNFESTRLGILHQKRFIKQYIYIKNTFKTLSKKAINAKIVDHCITVAKYYLKKRNPQTLIYIALAIYYRPDLILKAYKKTVK